ncbi:protein [Lentinula edodes]|uniref:Protein n=1 Tax=Lentinula edodes TaxID=5353 RepID=A0A1Q3DWC9_LENED|nr:protein [Lentinula edodes]
MSRTICEKDEEECLTVNGSHHDCSPALELQFISHLHVATYYLVSTVYSNLWHPVWDGCGVWDPSGKLEGEEKKKLEGQRLVDTLNWEWTPGRGILLDYDPVDFVVRMLKSPGGLVLVGAVNIGTPSGVANVEQFVLSKTSAMTKILQEKSGVPKSRMERPFFTLLEDHMGLGESDIRAITNAKPNYKWYHKFRRVEGWEDHLKWLAVPREGEEETVTEDTLVILNAGAHWSRHELGMLRAPTDAQEQVLLEDTYPRMIDLVTSRLSPIERTSIYYRSTSPGHPQCEDHSTPYKDMADARRKEQNLVQRLKETVSTPDDKKQRSRWDWDLFKPHNELWNRTIQMLTWILEKIVYTGVYQACSMIGRGCFWMDDNHQY